MKTQKSTACPLCDSTKVEVRHDRTAIYPYLGKKHVLEGQEHTVCKGCGTSFYDQGQISRNNERFIAWSSGLVKDIPPWKILEIREKYDITQDQANKIFNCGSPTQFSKWERGIVAPTGTAALTLLEALRNPTFMKTLADQAGVKIATLNSEAPRIDIWNQVQAVENLVAGSDFFSTEQLQMEYPELALMYMQPNVAIPYSDVAVVKENAKRQSQRRTSR